MSLKKKRPVYLNLLQIRLPVGGVVSIFHRVTGVLLVLLMPLALYMLQRSLANPEGFEATRQALISLPARLILLAAVAALAHHFFAGIRHLLLDIDIGISRNGGRISAWLVILADVVIVGITGVALL